MKRPPCNVTVDAEGGFSNDDKRWVCDFAASCLIYLLSKNLPHYDYPTLVTVSWYPTTYILISLGWLDDYELTI
jgi:hypothetical protein